LLAVKETVKRFNELRQNKPIRIVSHMDCDGLSSAAILSNAFYRHNIKFVLSMVRFLDNNVLEELSKEPYDLFIFSDIGSSYLKDIEKHLGSKSVFILDHHMFEDSRTKAVHLNPHAYGIHDYAEVSGSGVAYFFSKSLDEANMDLSYIALIGAIGDIQEKNGFTGLNQIILEDAISSGKISLTKGLKLFGTQTRPLHKALEYSIDPYIPGVTGSEDGAMLFLNELNISMRNKDNTYKKVIDLTEEELKQLVTGIILRRLGSEENPEDIFGPVYSITSEEEGSTTRDAKEYSTLLNCCARLGKPSIGLGTFFKNKKAMENATGLLSTYKKEIIISLDWFHKNRKTTSIMEKHGYVIINAEDNVRDTLIGTLASMISKLNLYDLGTIILSMAHSANETKISLRLVGYKDVDLRGILQKIVGKVGNHIVGGHKIACGALIPQEKEFEFIKIADQMLSKFVLEENIAI